MSILEERLALCKYYKFSLLTGLLKQTWLINLQLMKGMMSHMAQS